METLAISRLTSRYASPVRVEVSWPQLVAQFADPCLTACTTETCLGAACPHKEGGCWSPAVFREHGRSAQDVESVSCLVLDINRTTDEAFDAMRELLVEYRHVIHVTHADRHDARCLRIIVQLSRAVAPGEWLRFWQAAVRTLKAPVEASCSDMARCYYLPSRPRDAGYFVASHGGAPLDVDALLALLKASAQEGVAL